jgi:hypothetical protein
VSVGDGDRGSMRRKNQHPTAHGQNRGNRYGRHHPNACGVNPACDRYNLGQSVFGGRTVDVRVSGVSVDYVLETVQYCGMVGHSLPEVDGIELV